MKICLSCEGISATDLQRCSSCGTELLPIEAVHYPLRRGEEDAGNPLLGSRIDGKFRITNVLGKGGMGTVFRAVHEVSLVPVALKILHPRYAALASYREGFLAEARKAGRVFHEHCARILDVGEAEDGTVYIAQELVEGETLDEWIHGGPGLTPVTAVEILLQLCRALVAAHAVGLVHRDLSTRNVMVLLRDGAPFVKILDFGIAKGPPEEHPGGDGAQVTASFANPAYSAPEQLAGQNVDARADLYSLGVIAYEALCRKLPVAGSSGRELARATVEGRLLELPNLPGVPAELHRLVERLLARDPEERPASSAEVLGILERLQRPSGLGLRRLAVGLLAVVVLLLTVAYTGGSRETYLRVRAGVSMDLAPVRLTGDFQELHSDELRQLQFDFAGFDPAGLVVEVSRERKILAIQPLVPVVGQGSGRDRGQLTLTADDPGYLAVLRVLKGESRGGVPLDLTFRVEGQPVGYARVLVDDEPPELTLVLRGEDSGVVRGTVLDMSARDSGTIAELWVRVRDPDQERILAEFEIPDPSADELPLGRHLERYEDFAGAAGVYRDLEVLLWARDRAGNVGSSKPVRISHVDLKAPEILAVTARGGGDILTYGSKRATVRLDLDALETGLKVRVLDPNGRAQTFDTVTPAGPELLDLDLSPFGRDGGEPFADGVYRFWLEDPAGNQSSEFAQVLFFRSREVRPVFSIGSGQPGKLVVLDDRLLVTDGDPAQFAMRCNEAFRPELASLHVGVAVLEIPLGQERGGFCTLAIPSLSDGLYKLELTMRNLSEGDRQPIHTELLVMRRPVQLQLPDTESVRFLPELEALGLFGRGVDDRLEQGRAWSLVPPDRRLLRGDLWFGTEESPVHREVAPRADGELLFSGLLPVGGRNSLLLALRDVLGRPVEVRLGDRPAPVTSSEPDQPIHRVATFHYQSRAPETRESEIRVEYDQPARLVIQSPLPFDDTDRDDIHLRWTGRPLGPDITETGNGGSELEFELPFQDLVSAVEGLGDLRPEGYGAGELFSFEVTLQTPAGDHLMKLTLRTSRSVLTEVTLGELAGARGLPGPLAALRMVPVLAPSPIYPDPVPGELAVRSLYRPAPEIALRNTQDVYLQGRELTRTQYEAAVSGFVDLPARARGEWKSLVHSADPLGADRVSRAGMLPAHLAGPAAETRWRRSLQAGERPVTGIDYFQAYTVTRIIGVLVAGDPGLLRLPLGMEMEMAALGEAPRSGIALNGLGGTQRGDIVRAHEEAAQDRDDPLRWPPTAAESRELGDSVTTDQGFVLIGLDFGVREWVLDLPYSAALENDALLREWMADHRGHVDRTLALAQGFGLGPGLDELAGHLSTFGVTRGLALGEVDLLVDGEHGGDLRTLRVGPLPPSLPGVVRVLQLRRDGRDLLEDQVDPRLGLIGLRLAGGEEFVAEVRAR